MTFFATVKKFARFADHARRCRRRRFHRCPVMHPVSQRYWLAACSSETDQLVAHRAPSLLRANFQPLGSVPADLLKSHLLEYGLPAEIIEWKYFDSQFRPAGERGYVWLKDGRVRGVIGLIPFVLGDKTEHHSCAWTCDWFVAVSALNPGIGALLLKHAIDQSGLLTTIGGNEATSRMVPRMATHTVPSAAFEWILPLRLGGTRNFQRLANRLPPWSVNWLRNTSVASAPRVGTSAPQTRVHAGIYASALEPVLGSAAPDPWTPRYDLAYVDWQLGRCPAVEVATVWASDHGAATGAVIWRARNGSRWRIELWTLAESAAHAGAVLAEAIRQVRKQGGHVVSVLLASADTLGQSLFSSAGFRRSRLAVPLYVLGSRVNPGPEGLRRLSYLDSDLAYRF